MDRMAQLRPLNRVYAGRDRLVCHINPAQRRIAPQRVQHPVIRKVVPLNALDDRGAHAAAQQLAQPVQKPFNLKAVGREFPVAADNQHTAAVQQRGHQPGGNPPRLVQVLPDMADALRARHVRVRRYNRHARRRQPVDLLLHGQGVGGVEDKPVDLLRFQPRDALEILPVGTPLELFHHDGKPVVPHAAGRRTDALAHLHGVIIVPVRDDKTDLFDPDSLRLPPHGRRLISGLVDDPLYALLHFGRNAQAAVDYAVDRAPRYPAAVGNHLCCDLHKRAPFPLPAGIPMPASLISLLTGYHNFCPDARGKCAFFKNAHCTFFAPSIVQK